METRFIKEKERELPVIEKIDVIVAGGGVAGLAAAVSSARHGARILLVEQYGFLACRWNKDGVILGVWKRKFGVLPSTMKRMVRLLSFLVSIVIAVVIADNGLTETMPHSSDEHTVLLMHFDEGE